MNKSGSEKIPLGIGHRILQLFTVVYPGEALTVFLLMLNIFLILTAYSILKPVRKALILTGKTPEIEAYLYGAMAVVLIFVIKLFSYLSSKVPRQLLITWVTLFFISNLALFFILHLLGTPIGTLSVIFYIWVGIYNVFLIAQFWGFANDIYTEEAGKRLFVLIMLGQNLGALLGAKMTSLLVRPGGPFSPYQLMLFTGFILFVCIILTFIIHKREIKRTENKNLNRAPDKETKKIEEKPLPKGGGFRIIFKSRYLILIAFVILALNYVNTTGEFIRSNVWYRTAEQAKVTGKIEISEDAKAEFLTKLEADFTFIVNLLALLIQLFLVSRIFKWFGVRGALLFLPFIALGGYFIIALGASFAIVKWAKALENSTDYSLMNTTRGALFLITSREAKYKAKAAIDTFFVRTGDVLHSLTVFIGTTFLALSIEKFARINVVVAVIWIILCLFTMREHRKISAKRQNIEQIKR